MDGRAPPTTYEYFSTIMASMERNGDPLKATGLERKLRVEELWKELTVVLNSMPGGPHKSTDKWKKVWADFKTKTKKKAYLLQLKNNNAAAGGGAPVDIRSSMNPLENRVLAFMGWPRDQPDGVEQERPPSVGESVVIKDESMSILSASPSPSLPEDPIAIPCSSSKEMVAKSFESPASSVSGSPGHESERAISPDPLRTRPRRVMRLRRRIITPIDRLSAEFSAIERSRLKIELLREKNEAKRIRLDAVREINESRRLKAEEVREQNEGRKVQAFNRFTDVLETFLRHFVQFET